MRLSKCASIFACSGVRATPALAAVKGSLRCITLSSISTTRPNFLSWSSIVTGNVKGPGDTITSSASTAPAFANSGDEKFSKYLSDD